MAQHHIVRYYFKEQKQVFTISSIDQPHIYVPASGQRLSVTNYLRSCEGLVVSSLTKITFSVGGGDGIFYETDVVLEACDLPGPDEQFGTPEPFYAEN